MGRVIALGSFPAGAELVFGIFVRNTGPSARTAQVTLTDRGERFHLFTRNDHGRAALRAALERFEAALVARDRSALYALMNRGIRAAYTEATFARQGAAEAARVSPIVAVRRGAVASLSTTPYLAYFIPEGDPDQLLRVLALMLGRSPSSQATSQVVRPSLPIKPRRAPDQAS